jgi:hypothetical protein
VNAGAIKVSLLPLLPPLLFAYFFHNSFTASLNFAVSQTEPVSSSLNRRRRSSHLRHLLKRMSNIFFVFLRFE